MPLPTDVLAAQAATLRLSVESARALLRMSLSAGPQSDEDWRATVADVLGILDEAGTTAEALIARARGLT